MKLGLAIDQLEPWLDDTSDASPELRSFLRLAAPLPDDSARVERLRQRLGTWLAVAPPTPAAPAPVPAHVTSVVASGTGASGTLAGLVGIGKVGLVAVSVAAVAAAATWGANKSPRELAMAAPSVAPSFAAAPQLMPERDASAAPMPSQATPATPAPVARSVSGRGGSAAPLRLDKGAAPPPASLAVEATQLAAARGALSSSPALALSLLRRHAVAYPRSTLGEERQLFIIEALVRLELLPEAKLELLALQQHSPRSPHLVRAERLLSAKAPAP